MSTCGICHDADDASFPVCQNDQCARHNKMCWTCLNGHCESQRRFNQIPSCPWCRGPLRTDLAVDVGMQAGAQLGAMDLDVEDGVVDGVYFPDDYEDVVLPFDPIMVDAMFDYPYDQGVQGVQGPGAPQVVALPQVPPALAAHYLAYNEDYFPGSPIIPMAPTSPSYYPDSPRYSPTSPSDAALEPIVFHPPGHRLNPINLAGPCSDNRANPIELC